ncbi:MAG: glycosyltransferase family 9 protein [Bacteroidota bacterium]
MKKILVIQNKRIGDVLISSVIANNIKTVFPDSQVDYFVYDYTTPVLANNPNIDNIIEANDAELKKVPKLISTIVDVRKRRYDIIFDPYAKFQSRLMCLFSKAEFRIGLKRAHKTLKIPYYTHPISFLDKKSKICGKAIEDRINLINKVFPLKKIDYSPRLYLTKDEKSYDKLVSFKTPIIMYGVLGSTPQKSMPYVYTATLIDYIIENKKAKILFNYSPNQKKEALKIYELCKNKEAILLDIYEEDLRTFICLMNKCDALIANEGGIVHIAKALNKPTFTIFSPYVNKDHWASFEDGKFHVSTHLLEEKPDLYDEFTFEERKKIEANPNELYKKLTPDMILQKLKPFLDDQIPKTS